MSMKFCIKLAKASAMLVELEELLVPDELSKLEVDAVLAVDDVPEVLLDELTDDAAVMDETKDCIMAWMNWGGGGGCWPCPPMP
jgi:hypothetical protein